MPPPPPLAEVTEDEGTPVDVDPVEQSPSLDIEPESLTQGIPKITAGDKQVQLYLYLQQEIACTNTQFLEITTEQSNLPVMMTFHLCPPM